MGRHTRTGRKKERWGGGRREPRTPRSRKPTPGSAGGLGAEERSAPRLCPALAGTRGTGFIPPPRQRLRWEGAIAETPRVIPDNLQEEQRKREGGQRCELEAGGPEKCAGKGFLVPQPHEMSSWGGQILGHTKHPQLPRQPAVLEDISATLPGSRLCAGLGSGAGRDAARKHPWAWATVALWTHTEAGGTEQHPGAAVASQTLCSLTAPSPVPAHSPVPPPACQPRLHNLSGREAPPDPCAAPIHPGGILHTAASSPSTEGPSFPQCWPTGKSPVQSLQTC